MIYLQEYIFFYFRRLLGNVFANWATDDEELYKSFSEVCQAKYKYLLQTAHFTPPPLRSTLKE